MKVLGIVGSARHDGNTACLVKKVLEGAKSVGLDTKLLYISDYQIEPCRACMKCKDPEFSIECVQEDGMRIFYDEIKDTKLLVIGSPIYFQQISGQTKMFLDRLFCYVLQPTPEKRFPKGVKYILAFTCGGAPSSTVNGVAEYFRSRLSDSFGMENVGILTGTAGRPVAKDEALLEQAFLKGKDLSKISCTLP